MVIGSLLNKDSSTCQQWEVLADHYGQKDLLSQYELRACIHSEKLKDAEDTSCYIGVFEEVCRHFIEMGVTYSDEESIFDLLQGLSKGIEWEIFCGLMFSKLSTPSQQSSSSTFTFADTSKSLLER